MVNQLYIFHLGEVTNAVLLPYPRCLQENVSSSKLKLQIVNFKRTVHTTGESAVDFNAPHTEVEGAVPVILKNIDKVCSTSFICQKLDLPKELKNLRSVSAFISRRSRTKTFFITQQFWSIYILVDLSQNTSLKTLLFQNFSLFFLSKFWYPRFVKIVIILPQMRAYHRWEITTDESLPQMRAYHRWEPVL